MMVQRALVSVETTRRTGYTLAVQFLSHALQQPTNTMIGEHTCTH